MAQDLMERLRQICVQIEEEKDAAISSLIDRLLARDDQKGSETDLREETAREKTATLALRRWLGPTVTQRLRAQYPLRPELFLAAVRLTEYYMEHQMTDQACALMDHLVTLSEERNRADPDRHREIVRRALWYTVDVNALLTCRIGDGQRRYYEGVADYNASRFFWFYAFALTAVGREREGIPLFRRCHELCLQVEGETSWIGARAGLSYHSAQMGRADTAASEAYLRDTLEKLEAEYSRRFPQTVQFTQLSFARVCEALGDGAALIEYYFARGEQTLSQPFVERSVLELDIFITKKTGGRAQLFHLKDPNGDEIVQQAIDFVALLQDPENVTGSGQKAALRGTLYRELLAPVVKHLEGVTTLYLAPMRSFAIFPLRSSMRTAAARCRSGMSCAGWNAAGICSLQTGARAPRWAVSSWATPITRQGGANHAAIPWSAAFRCGRPAPTPCPSAASRPSGSAAAAASGPAQAGQQPSMPCKMPSPYTTNIAAPVMRNA